MGFPADTFQEAVDLSITASNQLHTILNGDANAEVTVEDGSKIPSVRKAIVDNFYFKDPIAWQVGQTENVFNQLRQFTDGSWWYAPSATASNLISMGATPIGDPLWKIYDFDAIGKLEPRVDEALRRSYAEAGYNLVEGSFEAGGTLVNANDVLLQERTGKAFSGPAGTVAAGTNPASGGFVDKSGGLLRHELATCISTFETMQDLLESTGLINNSVVRVLSRDGLGSQGGLFKITDTAPAVIDNFRNVPLFNGGYAVEYLQHPRTNPKLAFSGTKVCAHRGLSQQAPENSIASIAAAHRVGIEFAELDIIPCADGIICLHDDTIDRTTVGVGKIKDLTLAEIQSYDMKPTTVLSPIIQTNFTKYFGGERIPTLQQVLDEAKRTGITLVLESKFFNEEAIRDYYKILEKNKMLDSVIITTSSINNLHIYRTLNPDIPLGLNYLVSTQVTIESLDMLELIQNCWVIADHTVLNKNIVDEALSRGINVMSYTVNTVAVYQSLADMGVSLAMANWRVA